MVKHLRILHLEDNADDLWLTDMTIKRAGIECTITDVAVKEEFVRAIEGEEFDLVLADHFQFAFNSIEALKMLRIKYPAIPFIFVSGNLHQPYTTEIMNSGANAYISKDNLKGLGTMIRGVLKMKIHLE